MKLSIIVRKEEKQWFIEGYVENMTEKEFDILHPFLTTCPEQEENEKTKELFYSDYLIKGFSTEFEFTIMDLKKDLRNYYVQLKKELKLK